MSKRRSSTRVGRKHPRPTPPANPPQPARRYIVSHPVMVENTVCRVLRASDTHIEVQEWQGMYWQPSARPLWLVEEGVPATAALLEALGIPRESWPNGTKLWTVPELRLLTGAEVAALLQQEPVA